MLRWFLLVAGCCATDRSISSTSNVGWTVMSGPCMLDQNSCIHSPKHTSEYPNNGSCVIQLPDDNTLTVQVVTFQTKEGDALWVNGVPFSGSLGPQDVVPMGTIQWHPGSMSADSADSVWMICLAEAETARRQLQSSFQAFLWVQGSCRAAAVDGGYELQGTLLSGKPFYKRVNPQITPATYLFYDPDCNGNGDTPSWIFSRLASAPSASRSEDLDGDGACVLSSWLASDADIPPLNGAWTSWCGDRWTSDSPTISNADLQVQGSCHSFMNGFFALQGMTLSGRPYFKLFTSADTPTFLYYDPSCNGGSADPRWIFKHGLEPPSTTRDKDLDNDSACFVSSEFISDAALPPVAGTWNSWCNGAWTEDRLELASEASMQERFPWGISSGSCTLHADGCISSKDYPSKYPDADQCTIQVTGTGTIRVQDFDTEAGYDYLTVNGKDYSGAGVSQGPNGVRPTGAITWASDSLYSRKGFKICLEEDVVTTLLTTQTLTTTSTGVEDDAQPELKGQCNFEEDLCGWITNDPQAWRRTSGETPSGSTGPPGAYEGQWYIYLEASGNNHPNKAFFLQSPEIVQGYGVQLEVRFSYHMSGSAMGTLELQYNSSAGWTSMQWALTGHQGDLWHQASPRIPPEANAIRFVGTTGDGFQSDMAVDDIQMEPSIPNNTKLFAELTCNVDDIEECAIWNESSLASWQRVNGSAHQGQWCLQAQGDSARQREFYWKSSAFAPTSKRNVLSLAYQIVGSGSVALKIEGTGTKSFGSWTVLFQKLGDQGPGWHRALVQIPVGSTAVQAVAMTSSSHDLVRLDELQACASSSGNMACTCSEGHFLEGMDCAPCRMGAFKDSTGNQACTQCPAGRWSNATMATSSNFCQTCMPGSTTLGEGSTTAEACLRPESSAVERLCYSGHPCLVDNVAGYGLQENRHRMMISSSDCSTSGKSAVPGVANSGISQLSTDGRRYEWKLGFAPAGGVYHLCWCANMSTLTCTDIESNFLLTAGMLNVSGPNPRQNNLECNRGADCTNLTFQGHFLSPNDRVAVRRDECGTRDSLPLSDGEDAGIGHLQARESGDAGSSMVLGFGESTDYSDYRLTVDASRGYNLCWCSFAESECKEARDFNVAAGKLRVLGPRSNQEESCAIGQVCTINIQGIVLNPGDRLMVLANCGRGSPVPGLPGNGIAQTDLGDLGTSSFHFLERNAVVDSDPGIYRMCYCRNSSGTECNHASQFKAPIGLMTVPGPFRLSLPHACLVGHPCDVSISGVGLALGDKVFLARTEGNCSFTPAFPHLKEPKDVGGGEEAFRVSFGELPTDTSSPGRYQLCWCPKGVADCSFHSVFGAAAGVLQVECPPGTFRSMRGSVPFCSNCPRGFVCLRGMEKFACNDDETTLTTRASSQTECECNSGFFFSEGSRRCMPCPKNQFKVAPGNAQQCHPCPGSLTTHAVGSVSNKSCVDNEGSSMGATAEVPAAQFNVFIMSIASSAEALTDKHAQIVQTVVAEIFRIRPSAIQISMFNRTIQVRLNYRTEDEREAAIENMDVKVLTSDLWLKLKDQNHLQDADLSLSDPERNTSSIQCPEHQSVPAGIFPVSPEDCECNAGYEGEGAACEECPIGKYKELVGSGNIRCRDCPEEKSTVTRAATSLGDCKCRAGKKAVEESGNPGNCTDCSEGHFCEGTGEEIKCPDGSTSNSKSEKESDCFCKAGFYRSSSSICEECESGRFKPKPGDEGQCPFQCPANANSSRGASTDLDCFCREGYYAMISGDSLQQCENCAKFPNLVCKGGWADGGKPQHRMPVSKKGYFQTGLEKAFKCRARVAIGRSSESSCLGGEACPDGQKCQTFTSKYSNYSNTCREGSAGMLCGECPKGWSRTSFQAPCQECTFFSAWLLILTVILDVSKFVFMFFFITSLAASSAAQGGHELHATIQRMASQCMTACSVLTIFELDLLRPFSYSGDSGSQNPEIAWKTLPWPPEVTGAMNFLFEILTVIPTIVSTEFRILCQTEALHPENIRAKSVAIGVYNLVLPLLVTLGIFVFCAFIKHVVVPIQHLLEKINKMFKKMMGWSTPSAPKVKQDASPESVIVEITGPEKQKSTNPKDTIDPLERFCIALDNWPGSPSNSNLRALGSRQPAIENDSSAERSRKVRADDQHPSESSEKKERDGVSEYRWGLFKKEPGFYALLRESMPVVWIGLYSLWPSLLSSFLRMIWCVQVEVDGSSSKSLVLPNPDVECWSDDHLPAAYLAITGLMVWCVGIPVALATTLRRLNDDRQTAENFRKYGYFMKGFEPEYWWWDILVKRADIGVLMVVTYTSIVHDPEAKLMLFPVLSGIQFGLAAVVQPYSNDRALLLDFLECLLLAARFILFSAVAMLLILAPSDPVVKITAWLLVIALAILVAYLLLHFFAQFLQKGLLQNSAGHDRTQDGRTIMQRLKDAKANLQHALFLYFAAEKAEQVKLEWKDGDITTSFSIFDQSSRFRNGMRQVWGMALRFHPVYQHTVLSNAHADFTALCLSLKIELPRECLWILFALATSHRRLQSSGRATLEKDWPDLLSEAKTKAKGSCTPEDIERALLRLRGQCDESQKKVIRAAIKLGRSWRP